MVMWLFTDIQAVKKRKCGYLGECVFSETHDVVCLLRVCECVHMFVCLPFLSLVDLRICGGGVTIHNGVGLCAASVCLVIIITMMNR